MSRKVSCQTIGVQEISTMSLRTLIVLVVVLTTVFAQRNTDCTTPNGETAKCVAVRSCQVIFAALKTRNTTAKEFAVKSQCGYDTEALVCCGTSGYLTVATTLPSYLDIFTKAPDTKPPPPPKEQVEQVILSNFNTKELPDRTVCGLEKEADRIVGGEVTDIDEFPWIAALEYTSKITKENLGIRCGGSLINNRYVLTAAHCIIDNEFELVSVWLGEWKISENPDCQTQIAFIECADDVEKLSIKEQIPHPFYTRKPASNDIGLLRLERDVTYTDYIRPICLPPTNLPSPSFGTRMTVAGWGATENGTTSDIKLKVNIPLITNEQCNDELGSSLISADQLCAREERGKNSCQGDSGGPLMRTYQEHITKQSQLYQEGVVSWGVGCARAGYPAVYTRVSRYTNWIIDNIRLD